MKTMLVIFSLAGFISVSQAYLVDCYSCVSSKNVPKYDKQLQTVDPNCAADVPDRGLVRQGCLACMTIYYDDASGLPSEKSRLCVTPVMARRSGHHAWLNTQLPVKASLCDDSTYANTASVICFCKQDNCAPVLTGYNIGSNRAAK